MILCAAIFPTRFNISLPQDGLLHFIYKDRAVGISIKQQQGVEIISYNGDDLSWLSKGHVRVARINAIRERKREPIKFVYFSDNGILGAGEKSPKVYSIIWVFFELESTECLDNENQFREIKSWLQDCLVFFIDHYRLITSDNDVPGMHIDAISLVTFYTATEYKFSLKGVEANFNFNKHIFNWDSTEKTGHLKEIIPAEWTSELQTLLTRGEPIPIYQRLMLDAKRQAFYVGENELSILLSETAFETFLSIELTEYCERKGLYEIEVEKGRGKTKKALQNVVEKESISNVLNCISKLSGVDVKGSEQHKIWQRFAYTPRNLIIHRGAKGFKKEDAQRAFRSVNEYMTFIKAILTQ